MRDFNKILEQFEKSRGRERLEKQMDDFRNAIENITFLIWDGLVTNTPRVINMLRILYKRKIE